MRQLITILIALLMYAMPSSAQSGWGRALSGLIKITEAITIDDEEFAEAVKEEVVYLDKQNKVLPANNAYSKRLARLTKNMTDAEGIPLNFKVYYTKEINAFACPDGSVRVYSALMDALTDDELLGVLGHEIGHVALRHSHKAWRDALLRSAASDALGVVSDTWARLSDSMLGDLSSVAISAKHSRYHEMEADDYGYEFLKQCGKDPMAMIKMFEKLKKLSNQGSSSRYSAWLQAFSSHPDFDERIERMNSKADEDGY